MAIFYKLETDEGPIKVNELLEKTSIRACDYLEPYLYFEYNDGYIDPSWILVTAQEIYETFGEENTFGVTYEDAYSNAQPEPEPEAPDPTIFQLTQIIVETSVNVDYLVAMQSFQ